MGAPGRACSMLSNIAESCCMQHRSGLLRLSAPTGLDEVPPAVRTTLGYARVRTAGGPSLPNVARGLTSPGGAPVPARRWAPTGPMDSLGNLQASGRAFSSRGGPLHPLPTLPEGGGVVHISACTVSRRSATHSGTVAPSSGQLETHLGACPPGVCRRGSGPGNESARCCARGTSGGRPQGTPGVLPKLSPGDTLGVPPGCWGCPRSSSRALWAALLRLPGGWSFWHFC